MCVRFLTPLRPPPMVLAIDGATRGRIMRWGLAPSSCSSSYPLINATVGKLETGSPWKFPWRSGQRRLFTMAGFCEPHLLPGGCKEPFGVRCGVGPMFGVADTWAPARGGTETLSCALVTMPANELLAEVHNEKLRMPAVLREESHVAWRSGSPEEALQALEPYPSDQMQAWQVSRRLYAKRTSDD